MVVVYRLEQDAERIGSIQKATLETESLGVQQTHGLVGSAEWWACIRDGALPLHTLRGTINGTWLGGMRDVPTCRVATEQGEKTVWDRYGEDHWYQAGNPIEIDYVVQTLKESQRKNLESLECSIVIEVRIGQQVPRPSWLQLLRGRTKPTRNRGST